MREILSVKDLSIEFSLRGKNLKVIRNCSLDLFQGESLAIVGESGSGKSVFTKSFLGMLEANGRITSGKIIYKDRDMASIKSEKQWLDIRGGEITMVFQDPMTALNPLMTIGAQIRESVELHSELRGKGAIAAALEMLRDVGIDFPEKRYKQYPHEFSGGMRQRVVIAAALACRPKILICDEPTTALDVTIQAQIMTLLKGLKQKYELTVVYITHDLGVVANVADRVAVMYAGEIIEIGTVREIFHNPKHPYTWALLSSLPQLGIKGHELYTIKGTPPNMLNEIKGDAFAPRNPYALEIDFVESPPFFEISPTHKVKSWLLDDRAPKTEPPEAISQLARMGEVAESKPSALADKNIYISTRSDAFDNKNILELRNVSVCFGKSGSKSIRASDTVKRVFKAVNNVSFSLRRGETFGLVGESGSGKTTIGRAIIRVNPVTSGEIVFNGETVSGKIGRKRDKALTRKIQMIFQDPLASLNERAKVDYIISEGLYNTRAYRDESERREIVARAMLDVGLLPEFSNRFPHEFSGGQRQRIGIARALVMAPELIIADEPISALDVSIRAQVLNLLSSLQKKHGFTYLFIAHDLSVMRYICDRIAVISKGVIVELAPAEELFNNPVHPYTRALLSAIPLPDPDKEKNKKLIVYNKPAIDNPPPLTEISPGHFALPEDI